MESDHKQWADEINSPPDAEKADGCIVSRHVHLRMVWSEERNDWVFDKPRHSTYYTAREVEKV